MASQTESPKLFATRDRRWEAKQAGTGGGGGQELAEGVMAAAPVVTCPGGPAPPLPVTCPQRPRSQRWRRDPPAREAAATALAAGFRPRPCSGCEERGGAKPDRTWFPEPRPEAVAPTCTL